MHCIILFWSCSNISYTTSWNSLMQISCFSTNYSEISILFWCYAKLKFIFNKIDSNISLKIIRDTIILKPIPWWRNYWLLRYVQIIGKVAYMHMKQVLGLVQLLTNYFALLWRKLWSHEEISFVTILKITYNNISKIGKANTIHCWNKQSCQNDDYELSL